MFTHAQMMYFYVESPLHTGTGQGVEGVDLPIQRERTTGYPMVQASGVKGKLRAEANSKHEGDGVMKMQLKAVFGPESTGDGASEYAGSLSPGDARILLFPVRSLAGVFAWVTSREVLARFRRTSAAVGVTMPPWGVPDERVGDALVALNSKAVSGDKVVLEEFSYEPDRDEVVREIGEWLAEVAFPAGAEYDFWRKRLPSHLVILPEDDFRDFVRYSTEVVTRIKIDNETKTVARGALWTQENVPPDSVFYVPLQATTPRKKVEGLQTGSDVLNFISGLGLSRVQIGGDETVGRGLVALRFGEVHGV